MGLSHTATMGHTHCGHIRGAGGPAALAAAPAAAPSQSPCALAYQVEHALQVFQGDGGRVDACRQHNTAAAVRGRHKGLWRGIGCARRARMI